MPSAAAWRLPTSRIFPCTDIHTIGFYRASGICGNLTAYDAMYVALAEALDAPLITRDKHLAASLGHHARIELV
jgi:predicted nucleic acid-binding protein